MINKIDNSNPNFKMAMCKPMGGNMEHLAKFVKTKLPHRRVALDKYIKRAGKNESYDLFYMTNNSMTVHNSKDELVKTFPDDGTTPLSKMLGRLEKKFKESGFFGKIGILIKQKALKFYAKHINPMITLPSNMIEALEYSEKLKAADELKEKTIRQTEEIFEKNKDIIAK